MITLLWVLSPIIGLGLIYLTWRTVDHLSAKYEPPPPVSKDNDWFFDRFTT